MSKARILVVEDEVIIGMEIEQSLQNLGYEVAWFTLHLTDFMQSSDDAHHQSD